MKSRIIIKRNAISSVEEIIELLRTCKVYKVSKYKLTKYICSLHKSTK